MSLEAPEQTEVAPPRLREVAAFFLKLGTIAFGGPAAHVGIMEDELVRRRKWLAAEEFLDLFAVANLLPGPSSTELAIFIGYRLRGVAGLLLAGTCFILPAFLIVAGLAWAYVRYGSLPAAVGILYGVKPVVIAIVVQALWRLSGSAVKTRTLAVLGFLALLASFVGINPLPVLIGAGAVTAMIYSWNHHPAPRNPAAVLLPAIPLAATSVAVPTLGGIFGVFLKMGCVVFGSGYVLLAFLQADLVTSRHWLTGGQLIDAVAIGQVTPGPVFTTATFIGYLLAGPKGAVAATVGIFAPAFVFVACAGPVVRRLRTSQFARALLDGFNVAALALMAFVTWALARAALLKPDGRLDGIALGVGLISAILLLRFKINSTWLIALGAGIGIAAIWVRK